MKTYRSRLLAPCQEGDHQFCVTSIVRIVDFNFPVQVSRVDCACDCHATEPSEPVADELDMPLLGEFYD